MSNPAIPDWQSQLEKNKSGEVKSTIYNCCTVVENFFPGGIRYNKFLCKIERMPGIFPWDQRQGSWSDGDARNLAWWLSAKGLRFFKSHIARAVAWVADDMMCNPAQEYLESLQWDGVPRLNDWLVTYLGAECTTKNAKYLKEVGSKWLQGVVARVLSPGCLRGDALVLVGPQGVGKTSVAQAIADAIHPGSYICLYRKAITTTANRYLIGKTIAELPGFRVFGKPFEMLNSFVSQTNFQIREKLYRMTASFIVTTNDYEFFEKPTGNHHWWPVTMPEQINIDVFKKDLPQLLAEATREYYATQQWWLQESAYTEKEKEHYLLRY